MTEPRKKNFSLPADKIRPIATDYGGCFATDRITCDGCKVGYMYREQPDFDADSGWRFFAGDEDEAYMDDVDKHGIYDVNTIANYDRDIIAFLDAPPGSRFAHDGVDGALLRLMNDQPGSR